jgi:hypothetical protein
MLHNEELLLDDLGPHDCGADQGHHTQKTSRHQVLQREDHLVQEVPTSRIGRTPPLFEPTTRKGELITMGQRDEEGESES